jgi:hypothetical protein
MVQRFSTTTRSAPASAASTALRAGGAVAPMANPSMMWSTGPSPATVWTVKPNEVKASAHVAATTDTPSERPRRKDTMAAVGTTR